MFFTLNCILSSFVVLKDVGMFVFSIVLRWFLLSFPVYVKVAHFLFYPTSIRLEGMYKPNITSGNTTGMCFIRILYISGFSNARYHSTTQLICDYFIL
jgi:hypothetical protein